jgi:hypothetical protein
MIDIYGPDIEAEDEVKALILESVNAVEESQEALQVKDWNKMRGNTECKEG